MKVTDYSQMLISDIEALKASDKCRLNMAAEVARLTAENAKLRDRITVLTVTITEVVQVMEDSIKLTKQERPSDMWILLTLVKARNSAQGGE